MDMKVFKNIFVKISVCLMLIAFSSGAAFSANPLPQPAQAAFDQKVVARASAERALEHIAYLSKVVGPRPGGMESEWDGAEYIGAVLAGYGFEVEFQPFSVPNQNIGTIILPSGEAWQLGAAANGFLTGDGPTVDGELIFVSPGSAPDDFPPETFGKIVLMQQASGTTAMRNQVNNAVNAGAVGVILHSLVGSRGNYGSAFSPSLLTSNPAKDNGVPVLGAALIQGIWLKEMLDEGPVTLRLQSKQYTGLQSLNVIGTKPAKNGDPDAPVILVTGHMDSVVGAPGANDNASGVAVALELARVYKSYNTDKELRFIAFGSEERGLVGANYYVNNLSDDERARIMGVFNGDMVATSYVPANPDYAANFNLYAMTVNGMPNLVTDGAVAAGARLGNSSILPGRFSSSDHVPFHNRGIPAALFIWMFWESTSVYDIEKVYHTPQDTIEENISLDRMQTALDIIGAAVFDVVRKDVPALEKSKIRSAEGF